MLGILEKMVITGYKDEGFSQKTGKSFTAMINPTIYGRKKGVSYNENVALDSNNSPAYKTYGDENLDLEFILDTTGVVPLTAGKNLPNLIKQLESTVYTYVGSSHQPPYIKIAWGTLSFQGRASNIEVEYTLFSPSGLPLRAKVKLQVKLFISQKTQELEKTKNSPDLSHLITVKSGDTLPGLCMRVYDSTIYCMEVARINKLTGIRNLEPGMELLFPPLTN